MSRTEVERFADALARDALLKAEVAATTGTPEATVALARSRGYDFTLEEAKAFVAARSKPAGQTLSDGDLDGLAGGFAKGSATGYPIDPGLAELEKAALAELEKK
ncbi:hypothetical protein BH11PSE3_BH11PSE3_22000 [soil metagenome]